MNVGLIEGFFGRPWDWPARHDTLDFLRDSGCQFYIYAPKADPFLRRRWREPLPDDTLRQLSELCAHGTASDVSVGIGLTPFEIYLNDGEDARACLRSKVRQINDTGVHTLCILFDDMRGDVDGLPALQAAVVDDVCAWSNARQFMVCPTYYSYDPRLIKEFGPPPHAYLRDLGQLLDPRIDIFWTGENVISHGYSAEHLLDVATVLRRKPFIWDNSISNDSKARTNHLYLDPSIDGWDLPADLVRGLAINPMNQAYLTRIALRRLLELFVKGRRANEESVIAADFVQGSDEPISSMQFKEDCSLMQEAGLNGMGEDRRRRLLARYNSAHSNPYARDIVAWLREEYRFDPQCLTS